MSKTVKDIFSGHADLYKKYRPHYPKELFEFIFQYVPEKNRALDCGTGNGQAAGILADHFKEVDATDISNKQIENAVQKANLHYHICKAEETPFADNTFDLITAATAVHWFRFPEFFLEMKRTARNNAVFACWSYKVLRTDVIDLNDLIDKFYDRTIHAYWDAERRHVDEQYKNIPFPFEEITNPGFATELQWGLDTLEGYLNTWSAVQHYIQKNKVNPVDQLMKEIRTKLQTRGTLNITFPIFMRIGIIRK